MAFICFGTFLEISQDSIGSALNLYVSKKVRGIEEIIRLGSQSNHNLLTLNEIALQRRKSILLALLLQLQTYIRMSTSKPVVHQSGRWHTSLFS
jgi:hypothetical protein